jgi:hypothetical protein
MTVPVALVLYLSIGAVPTAVAFAAVSRKSSLGTGSVWILGSGMTLIMAAMWLPLLVMTIAVDLSRKVEGLAKWSLAPDDRYEGEESPATCVAVIAAILAATHVARYLWK